MLVHLFSTEKIVIVFRPKQSSITNCMIYQVIGDQVSLSHLVKMVTKPVYAFFDCCGGRDQEWVGVNFS